MPLCPSRLPGLFRFLCRMPLPQRREQCSVGVSRVKLTSSEFRTRNEFLHQPPAEPCCSPRDSRLPLPSLARAPPSPSRAPSSPHLPFGIEHLHPRCRLRLVHPRAGRAAAAMPARRRARLPPPPGERLPLPAHRRARARVYSPAWRRHEQRVVRRRAVYTRLLAPRRRRRSAASAHDGTSQRAGARGAGRRGKPGPRGQGVLYFLGGALPCPAQNGSRLKHSPPAKKAVRIRIRLESRSNPRQCRGRGPRNLGSQTVILPGSPGYALYLSAQVALVWMDRAHSPGGTRGT